MTERSPVVSTEQFRLQTWPWPPGVGYALDTRSYYVQRGRWQARTIRDGDYIVTYADGTWDVVPAHAGQPAALGARGIVDG